MPCTSSEDLDLDHVILTSYMSSFFGYGNLDAPLWLIGMEEGGASTGKEVRDRLTSWDAHRGPCLDLAEHHARFAQDHWFKPGAPTQSTWRPLIRLALRARADATVDTEAVRAYQIERLGRSGGDLALLELLPLPKRSRRDWAYSRWCTLAEVATPRLYEDSVLAQRKSALRNLVGLHQPRIVVFYGLGFSKYWHAIARCGPLSSHSFANERHPSGAITSYLQLPHPVARLPVTRLFEEAGDLIRRAGLLAAESLERPG